MRWLQQRDDGVVVSVKVVPRASRTEVAGVEDEWLRVRLQAPPVDGKANQALVRWLAKELKIARGDVELLGGAASRNKRLLLRGVKAAVVGERLVNR